MQKIRLFALGVFLGILANASPLSAQVVIGQCLDQTNGLAISIRNDGRMFVPATGQSGMTARDPSGQTFIQIQAAAPWQQAFFVTWNGDFVEVNMNGVFRRGGCNFMPGTVPPPPWVNLWQPPQPSQNLGIYNGNQFVPLPQALANEVSSAPFAPPLLATQNTAQNCWVQSGGNRQQFGNCMVRAMVGDRERAAYDCVRGAGGQRAMAATCIVGALGGVRERQIAGVIAECQRRFGSDYSRYPLCMASQSIPPDSAVGKLVACVQQQGTSGNVDILGTAVCYGAGSLRLNPEAQIAVQCAATTGGEPYAFAACAGGQLTARELDKCFTGGIGGSNGCFGPNNTIVQALSGAGQMLQQQFGPNNDLVKTWNSAYRDLTVGPGPNNDVVRAFRNVGNSVGQTFGPNNDIRKAVERVVPRIRIRL